MRTDGSTAGVPAGRSEGCTRTVELHSGGDLCCDEWAQVCLFQVSGTNIVNVQWSVVGFIGGLLP
jgi:hypothetical protein